MTAPLPGGGRRAIVALRTAIEKGLVEPPKPVEYAPPPVTQAVAPVVSEKRPNEYFNEERKASDLHFTPEPSPISYVPQPEVMDIDRIEDAAPKKRKTLTLGDKAYRTAQPWPHAVIDDFLPDEIAEAAANAFPNADDPIWREHGREFTGDGHSKKLEMAKREFMPPALRAVADLLNGDKALEKFRKLTGFVDLMPDPSLYGGGLNLVPPGGFLKPHADWNFASHISAYRAVNLIVWLNRDWKEGDGGELQLWKDGKVAKAIEPLFNRAAIFTCSKTAVHGYDEVKAVRRSVGVYYYVKDAPKGFDKEPHKTIWQEP